MIAHQDYELAEQFMNMDMSFGLNPDGSIKDGKTVGKQLFQMEGIFLDLTDCRQAHPRFDVKQNQLSMKAILNPIKNLLVANIVWEVSKSFDLNMYLEKKWFVDFENELNISK